jgi:FKBP-type peptidyl-prolyl cis-trans isomerase FklB
LGVSQFIGGFAEALQLMPVGSKWQVYIPSDLAYGPQGPPAIGPNQVLIFDLELLEIIK